MTATNAISTAWLRCGLLPVPLRGQLQASVARYLDLHVEHAEAGADVAAATAVEERAARLQTDIWRSFEEDEEAGDPKKVWLLLVGPALNAMFDASTGALAARLNRLPNTLYLYLIALTLVAAFVVGYAASHGGRDPVYWAAYAGVVTGVILMLVDLDRPRRGRIRADVSLYRGLRKSLAESP